ncbi:MAG: hypothetical protein WCK47_05560 [bacterium]
MSGAAPARKRVYLAGAIEFAPDGGKPWRRDIARFLTHELGLDVFDPCTNEFEILTGEEKTSFREWKSSDRPRFLGVVRRIIDHDLDNLLHHTLFIICYWDRHVTRGAGTAGELTMAHHHGIPIYLVPGMPLAEVSSWAAGCATEIFGSFDDLKQFLRAK